MNPLIVPIVPSGPIPAHLPLPEATVHLWVGFTDDDTILRSFHEILSPEEKARVARYRIDADCRRATLGKGMVRMLLARYLSVPHETVAVAPDAQGKPSLTGAHADSSIAFNTAHSGEGVVVAFARGVALGVDVETARRKADHEKLARRYFAADEADALLRLPEAARAAAFLRAWTRKEAFLKALGTGLRRPLNSFSVSLQPDEAARLIRVSDQPEEAAHWELRDLDLGADYVAAVACRATGWRYVLRELRGTPDSA